MHNAETCKTIHFVRHAEGIHNRDSREIPNFQTTLSKTMVYWDAPLTPIGLEQSKQLALTVDNLILPPEIVVVSPLRRAIQTAELGFRANRKDLPFVATELARERVSLHTCDGRRPLSEIKADFPFVDFAEVVDEADTMWLSKEDQPSEDASEACALRAAAFLGWLHARPEKTIAVVSHWVFYTHLFKLFGDNRLREKFGNAEMRTLMLCNKNASAPSSSSLPP